MPAHNHGVQAAAEPNTVKPLGAVLAPILSADPTTYSTAPAGVPMHPAMVTNTGGGQPHPNVQPLLVLNYCIALEGIFPSRN